MKASDFGTIIEIGNVLVSEEVITDFFCCDYAACKGKCCIAGDCGAPLEEGELEFLERDYPFFLPLMSVKGIDAVDDKGFFEIDVEGEIVTPVVSGSQECAYSHFDGEGNCLCAIEKCFLEGKCSFRKPQSCMLYPIRVTKLTGGGLALNVHHWDICNDAVAKGKREGIRVYQFLREPLIGIFGAEFYEALCAAAAMLLARN